MELKILIYVLFVIVILLCIFSVYVFFHYRKLYADVTENVSNIFEGFKKEMLAIQNLAKQMTDFTGKTNKSIEEFKKEVRTSIHEMDKVVKQYARGVKK